MYVHVCACFHVFAPIQDHSFKFLYLLFDRLRSMVCLYSVRDAEERKKEIGREKGNRSGASNRIITKKREHQNDRAFVLARE
jgi:hypothetical protein